MEKVSKAYQRLTDNDDDDDDDRSCIHDNKINEKSVEEILPLKKDSLPFQTTLDVLPKDILHKVFSYLCLSDLICLEYSSQQLRYAVMPFWKLYCERYDLRKDPTPLCVGWQLNDKSLYSYDNAVTFCNYSVKRWRLLAIRCFLVETYRCVICGQHLKDRLSVDGFYFKHDVLLCFPDCYNIFTMNVNDKMVCLSLFYIFSHWFKLPFDDFRYFIYLQYATILRVALRMT